MPESLATRILRILSGAGPLTHVQVAERLWPHRKRPDTSRAWHKLVKLTEAGHLRRRDCLFWKVGNP
jgi:hypothetical protein